MSSRAVSHSWVAGLPPSLFTSIIGIGGLATAWKTAADLTRVPSLPSAVLYGVTGVLLVGLMAAYGLKAVRYPRRVLEDLRDPADANFFAALSMGVLIVGAGIAPWNVTVGEAIWLAGTGLHFIILLYTVRRWVTDSFEVTALNPSWFIPVVGSMLVPATCTDFEADLVSQFFFAVGLVFWIVLFAAVFNRVLFHEALPERSCPTLCIFMAPPALAFLGYEALTQGADDIVARVLYLFALFMAVLVASMAPVFVRLPFSLSWWAYTFPLGAVTTASLTFAEVSGVQGFLWFGIGLLTLTTGIVALTAFSTLRLALRGELFSAP